MPPNTRLREIRSEKKMNQSDFANLLGLTQSSLSKYENGLADAANVAQVLAEKLSINPTWYLTGQGTMYIDSNDRMYVQPNHKPMVASDVLASYGLEPVQKSTGFAERLKMARKALGYNQEEAAKLCGIARMTFSRYEKGETTPGIIFQKSIAATLNVDPDWLMTGEGIPPKGNGIMAPVSNYQFTQLPMLTYAAAATFDALKFFENDSEYMGSGYTVLKQPGCDYKNAVVINIEGNSMEPKFPSGSKIVAVPMPENQWEYASGYIAISLKAEVFMFKRVKSAGPKSIVLISENPQFPEEREVALDSINIMWKVLHLVYAPI